MNGKNRKKKGSKKFDKRGSSDRIGHKLRAKTGKRKIRESVGKAQGTPASRWGRALAQP